GREPAGERAPGGLPRRILGWAPLAVTACLLLVVGILAGGLMFGERDGGGASPAPPAATSTVPGARPNPATSPGERIAAENPKSKIKGIVVLHRKMWGTQVELYLAGVPKGSRCRLLVVARDGRRDMLGSWSVPYDKGYGAYGGSTMFQRGQLFSFEVMTLEGQPLLTIPT
uniref:hypothetical protein n=1 Tax=Actinomadura roseirufa TaxID=2094049 RepID=UPI001A9559E6